jgi:hypothetical protein
MGEAVVKRFWFLKSFHTANSQTIEKISYPIPARFYSTVLDLRVHSLLTKTMVRRGTLTVIYMLHRVIFDQHRPLVCREIVHKIKETVKRNVHNKKGKL